MSKDIFKVIREVMAIPFMILAIICGFLADIMFGDGYLDFLVKINDFFHNFFHVRHK